MTNKERKDLKDEKTDLQYTLDTLLRSGESRIHTRKLGYIEAKIIRRGLEDRIQCIDMLLNSRN